jgi:hypothetical protein
LKISLIQVGTITKNGEKSTADRLSNRVEVLTKDYSENSTTLITNEKEVLHLFAGNRVAAVTVLILKKRGVSI